jgi:hypothetical protein
VFFPGFVDGTMKKRAVLLTVQRNLSPSASKKMSEVSVKIIWDMHGGVVHVSMGTGRLYKGCLLTQIKSA